MITIQVDIVYMYTKIVRETVIKIPKIDRGVYVLNMSDRRCCCYVPIYALVYKYGYHLEQLLLLCFYIFPV